MLFLSRSSSNQEGNAAAIFKSTVCVLYISEYQVTGKTYCTGEGAMEIGKDFVRTEKN